VLTFLAAFNHSFSTLPGFDAGLVGTYDDLMLYVVKTESGYACCCGSFRHQWKMNVQNHVESIHFPGHFRWNCDVCGDEAKTRNILAKHKSKFHPKNPPQHVTRSAAFSLCFNGETVTKQ
jgi:hypothetical protein